MIDFLVNLVGRWKLKRRYATVSRKPKAMNLLYMKTAILVFHSTDESHYQQIIGCGEHLKTGEGFSKVSYVAYCSSKILPDFVDANKVTVLDNKMISINGIPNEEISSNLLNQEFDLMIDFTSKSFVPTDYFLALLNAKTKVGLPDSTKEYIFDLIIDIKDNQDVAAYFENILRYLKMINKD